MTSKRHSHLLIWRRSSRDIGHRRKHPVAVFLSFFLSAIVFLPHCPGFRQAVIFSAGLAGNFSDEEEKASSEYLESDTDISSSFPLSDKKMDTIFAQSSSENSDSSTFIENNSESVSEETNPTYAASSDLQPEILPENEAVLVHKTYTASPSDVYVQIGNSFVKNVTDYGNDTVYAAEEASPAFTLTGDGEVEVLIMHTHTTESYMPFDGDIYDTTWPTRSTDNTQNMAAVGNMIADELTRAGIGVIHDTMQHDYPSYNGSYDRSAETVTKYLREYPSIKVVLDIHRDAIISGDTVTAPIIESDEGTAAQVMIISGCDDGTMDYPNWRENLAFAIDLQQQMEADHPGFTRPVLFDYRSYNQRLTTGSLLIEVGGHGNTLPQAMLAGKWIGQSLAALAEKDG